MRHPAPLLLVPALLLGACGSPSVSGPPPAVPASPMLDLSEGQAPLPLIPIDPGVFGLRTQTTYLVCRNERSGPYERLQTDPLRTGHVNFVAGTAQLPPGQAATNLAFPYLYFGGQPRAGRAADAGMYADGSGVWIPVVNVEGVQRNLPRETDAAGNVFVYRVAGGQPVGLRMRVPADGVLSLDVTARWLKYQLMGASSPSWRTWARKPAPLSTRGRLVGPGTAPIR
ncbi:hypothetical protein [Deinococcus apachensis]|uniref:hypothetical protein n=1 Tax=Deinococcus apachensis TaxID=309886 RepID=UPI00037FB6BC|nr:hypothetical protein [Deinococcus apachensis]